MYSTFMRGTKGLLTKLIAKRSVACVKSYALAMHNLLKTPTLESIQECHAQVSAMGRLQITK